MSMNNTISFFKKSKIKKKKFKKHTHLIIKIKEFGVSKVDYSLKKKVFKRYTLYKKYIILKKTTLCKNLRDKKATMLVNISQKTFNPKCNIYSNKILNTFSVGSIIKYFKIKQTKSVRRGLKGLKVFLNFLKNSLEKFYLKNNNSKYLIVDISGMDYNLVSLKKNIKSLIKFNGDSLLFLVNLKISFTKKKNKKIKAIKKRLKKKILSNFIKNTV